LFTILSLIRDIVYRDKYMFRCRVELFYEYFFQYYIVPTFSLSGFFYERMKSILSKIKAGQIQE